MRITFFGAATEVGRSCIMIESDQAKVILDAGVKIGAKDEYPLIEDDELKDADAILISHAHLDHSAYLPHIYSTDYHGFIYTTKPTFELINVLVSDYLKISLPENVNKDALQKMQKHFKILEYNKEIKIKDLAINFVTAGHILGSAMINLQDNKNKVLYTGDVNLRTTKLLDPADTKNLNADTLITESTYAGDKDQFPTEKSIFNSMVSSIKDTINQEGKILIPSFGVGRAQEMLLILDDYMRSGVLPTVPIYTDGMVNKAMRIHRHNIIYCRDELQKRILLNDDDPFKSNNFVPVITTQQRRQIMSSNQAGIIVTTSGMLTGGPILKYVVRLGNDPINKILFVGYQAEGTRGRALLDGAKSIQIGSKQAEISMAVEKYHLSAHADRPQLIRLISSVDNLENILVIHGEYKKSQELANAVSKNYKTTVPSLKGIYTI